MSGKFTKALAFVMALVLLVGLLPVAAWGAENPVYTGAQGSVDSQRSDQDADVSCMTFNVLHYNSSAVQNYGGGDYATRRNYAVSLIRAYEPDIIGMQEAGDDAAHAENWPDDLQADLGDTYTPIILTDQTSQVSQMYITAALIIWYRTDRFQLLDSGAEPFQSCSVDCATTDLKRWFQWAKLYDTQEDKTVFVFNTHLTTNHAASTCSVCSTSTEGAAAGRQQRTAELAKLSAKIDALASGYPCFVTGDFNCTMADSVTNQNQLLTLSQSPSDYMQSALMTGDLQVTSDGTGFYDHVFIHTGFLRCRKLVGIKETVGGYIGSDHSPYIACCDYRAAGDIGPGEYDETAGTYTDTTASNQYTFQVTPGEGFTYKIFKDTGVQTGNTIWSVKDTSKYQIRFYDASGALYSAVDATIYATSAVKPTLSSTGVNQYYANHAYHVIPEGDAVTVTPVCTGLNTAQIYRDEACTDPVSGGSITGIPTGRSTYYLKHNVNKADGSLNYSEVFPLYLYRQTAGTDGEMGLYVDKNIGDATGTVAFWDGTDVRLVEGQVTGFSSLTAAQPTVNTADGYSIYMAPGEYGGNTASFTKSFSLYGVNWDVCPNERVVEGTWTLADRGEETVIKGQLLVSLYGDSVEEKSITVKGVTFTGQTKEGSIYLIENRGGTGNWSANSAYRVSLDIRNNIFTGWCTQSSSADINLNCASQKSGVIAGNYFSREVGRLVSLDTTGYPLTYDTAIFGRNINGLVIDSNRFLNYDKDFISFTPQVGYGSTLPGYAVYTVQDNRFENCVSTLNRLCNVTAATRGDVKYLGNYFIRCGYGTAAVFADVTETSGTTTDYGNCALTVMGNKFYECQRAFGIFRNGTTLSGDIAAMGLTLTQNAFHNPCEGAMQPKNGYSAGTAAENYTYSQKSYAASVIYFRLANAGQSTQSVPSGWNLAYNYFYSARLAEDFTNANHPSLYINSYMKEWSGGVVSAQYECMDESFAAAFLPYYVNHGCTNASTVDDVGTKPTATAMATVSGITAQGYQGEYDGKAHSITVTVPEGAFVSYSYGDSAATGYKCYSAANPTFTQPGTYTVTYRVIATGCKATYGTADVTITEASEPTLTPVYPTLEFEDEVAIRVYFTASGLGASGTEDMGLLTWSTPQSDGTIDSAQAVSPGAVYDANTGYYLVSSQGIAAKQLSDTVYFKIYLRLSDGSYLYTRLLSYSPQTYANGILSGSYSNEMKALVVSMLNYGAAAQTFFAYRPYDLMNANLTADQQALVEPYRADMVMGIVSPNSAKIGMFVNDGGFSSRYPSISFEGAFAINYFFTPAYTVSGDMTLYCWNADDYAAAQTLTPDNATARLTMTGETLYTATVEGIAAKNLDSTVYVAAVYSDGTTTHCSGILAYSIGAYCVSQASGTASIQPLAAATAVYGYYAKKYFNA